ncbi:MAG: UDP-N-acetylglucosamine 2-epimerase (non-hydrolyzing) [Dehalococcoidales bacterium]|nr:MAG: UDP-N-acetylglucosamine 2-epimerase (non-hydrolyzing) [Dehalococcoidales bacterium]
MKLVVVCGTRPEIIKMAPVIRELEKRNSDYFILHTGQHYSYNLDKVFFEQLEIPQARYNLEVGSGSHAEQTARILTGVEQVLLQEKPDVLLVEGDTNSVLGGALAAVKLHIRVGHVEAGLRSYDRTMPEEINRILTDHCSDYLFAPTDKAKSVLLAEGIPGESVFVTGNTIVDAVLQNLSRTEQKSNILDALNLRPKDYFLVTLHRQENVDSRHRFASILQGLDRLADEYKLPIVYPIHPRSQKRIMEYQLNPQNLSLIDPVDYLGFLQLENNAKLILTDSGGVQEESCILRVPCVTLRDNTERPETVVVGGNSIAGIKPEDIHRCSKIMLDRANNWQNPFGDGKAGERIVDTILGGK